MSLLFLFSVAVIFVVIIFELAAFFICKTRKDYPRPEPVQWPMVAVLIAARNEAAVIPACLAALERLDYPPERFSVWIGNDGSEDATFEIVSTFCKEKTNFNLFNITEQWGAARGKANVLAQLASIAGPVADFYFITDADVRVNSGWLKELLLHFEPGVGIVNGTTVVEGKTWFGRMQAVEWMKGQGMIKSGSMFMGEGKTFTAIGNNMSVERTAYEATGGFENIPFSLTEDFELNRQLNILGYKNLHIASAGAKVYTVPEKNLLSLLIQRKRWMSGAMQLPLPVLLVLFVQILFLPAILVILFYSPLLGLGFFLLKIIAQAFFVGQMYSRLEEPQAIPFLGFELYSFLSGLCQIIYYFLPFPVKWKGRSY